jgi:hypothetical protein
MTFVCRIADQSVTVVNAGSYPDLGSLSNDGRTVSLTAVEASATKDTRLAAISTLNSRLQSGCDLVLQTTGSTYPISLRLLPGGRADVLFDDMFELGVQTLYQVEAPCLPYATPANRVFLASPIGDELPVSDDVVVSEVAGYDAIRVWADGGEWRIQSGTTLAGMLELWGDCIADEILSVETISRIASLGTGTFQIHLSFRDGSNTELDRWYVENLYAVGRARQLRYFRVPAGAVRFVAVIFATSSAGTTDARLERIEVGRKLPPWQCLIPTNPATLDVGPVPAGWTRTGTIGNVSYDNGTWIDGWFGIGATNSAALAYYLSPRIRLDQNHRIGWKSRMLVEGYTSGTASILVNWYDESDVYMSSTTLYSLTANDADTLHYGTLEQPTGGWYARMELLVAAASTLTARWTECDMGEHIMEAPGDIRLTEMRGEVAAPLEIYGDVDFAAYSGATHAAQVLRGSDAHRVHVGVGINEGGPYVWEAEELTWTGGTTATTTSADDYPGTGNTGKKNTGTVAATAPIDTSQVKDGTYELFVRVRASAGDTGTLTCTESTKGATGVTTDSGVTTPCWRSLGQVGLPCKRTHPGTAANITVSMVGSDAGAVVQVDRYMLIPISHGGYAYYHDEDGPTSVKSEFDVLADGTLLLDNAVDMTDCGGVRLMANATNRLVVLAEETGSDETGHPIVFFGAHMPEYSLWQ